MAPRRSPDSASTFTSALKVYTTRAEVSRLSTGSQRLDQLLGGIEASQCYLLFGSGKDKVPDRLLYRLMVETIKNTNGHVVYMLCGNYRRDRTTLDSELLLNLLESDGLNIEDSLSRIHIIGVFSEAQLMSAPDLVEEIVELKREVRLLAVQQISKLFYSETAIGFEDKTVFTGIVSKLKEICAINQIPFVASCEAKRKKSLFPEPVGGTYLRHAVNVLLYLREMKSGDISAQIVKHFDKIRAGKRVRLNGNEDDVLGRITKDSMRGRIQDSMRHLRRGFREALKDDLMQTAFDGIWDDWNQEQGAMIYAQVVSAMDLLNLTGVLANRRELIDLREKIEALEKRDEN